MEERLREARLLCSLSQQEAAQRLGLSKAAELKKIEDIKDSDRIPLWLIARAAQVYEVSVDYLFGASDDWETGARMTQERETSAWLFEAWEKMRQRDLEVLGKLRDQIKAMEVAALQVPDAIDEVESALMKFRSLNPRFDDELIGGARLVGSGARAVEAASKARIKLKRFKVGCQQVSEDSHGISLSLL